jgi:hypothetical protein
MVQDNNAPEDDDE